MSVDCRNPQQAQQLVQELIAAKQVVAIMGPTASGKSQLSMALAQRLPVEIISVDSALIYRQMDIGSAKPSADEMAQVPHHLIDIIDAVDSYSASEFVADVHRLVAEIFARGKLPLLVGGTMMYFNALQQGMNDLPCAAPEVREKFQQQWQASPESLHLQLQEVDPESAQRIHPNDPQRLIRALEVYQVSGITLTEHRRNPKNALQEFELIKIALIAEDRSQLHQQIEQRFLQMLDQGFLKEVESLMLRGDLDPDMTSIRCVGYRQAWDYLSGDTDYETFVHKGVVATRQLAKRQLTWLRKEKDLLLIDPFATTLAQRIEQSCEWLSLRLKAG